MLVRIFSLAYHCLRDWLFQRISGAVMALYSLMWLALIVMYPLSEFATWQMLFGTWWLKLASLIFLASLLYHAWLGVRDISMDYIPMLWIRKLFQVSVVASLLLYGAWGVNILWSV
jgi:succinate dehydrogenase / fumarate reductase, membrane anchor subunit